MPVTLSRLVLTCVLYVALAAGANAQQTATEDLAALRVDDMRKLLVHQQPRPVPTVAFEDIRGEPVDLEAFRGQLVVLNFWATWCAPCREEMPSLDALEAAMGAEGLVVLPVATGRNPVPAIEQFFESYGIERLPIYRDPSQSLARAMGVMALPVTVLIDREGREIGRLIGEADWNGTAARALLAALAGSAG